MYKVIMQNNVMVCTYEYILFQPIHIIEYEKYWSIKHQYIYLSIHIPINTYNRYLDPSTEVIIVETSIHTTV